MKAMMEANPQMRAAMEAQIKMAEDAAAGRGQDEDMMTAMMPKRVRAQVKGERSLIVMDGGAFAMEILNRDAQNREIYLIDRAGKTYSRVPKPAAEEAKPANAVQNYTVTKGGASQKILGYTCEQYLVDYTQNGQKGKAVIWATDDIPGLDADTLAGMRFGEEDAGYFRSIEGVPLKMEMSLPQMRLTMTAQEMQAGGVADAVFELPAGFVEKPHGAFMPTMR
jgi:hypothetical protein